MSAPAKCRKVLSQTQISELIWDSDSDEAGASNDSSSEDEEGFEDKPGVSLLQPDRPTSIGQISSSSVLQVPLRKRKLFRVGQVDRYTCRLPHGRAPLALRQV
jgi:hypothetical protein